MDIILIPGLWLDAASWDRVVPILRAAGHRVVPIPPPGHDGGDPRDATYEALVGRIVSEIDAGRGPAVIVGHSAACGAAWAAADRRVDRVAAVVLVGGFPIPGGQRILDGFEPVDGVIAFPGWSAFEGPDTMDLDEAGKAEIEGHMRPAPGDYSTAIQSLGDERRHGLPTVLVCTEYSSDELKDWAEQGFGQLAELAHLREPAYVDLGSGHWPQFTRPGDLAEIILHAATIRDHR